MGARDISQVPRQQPARLVSGSCSGPIRAHSLRLVALRHHASVWVAPAVLLVAALFPWPYGYYGLLRLAVFVVSAWIAYEQWRFDDAVSGWVVAFAGVALLYNPIFPVHLTREIWSVLNIVTAVLFLTHLWALNGLIADRTKGQTEFSVRRGRGLMLRRSLFGRLRKDESSGVRDITRHGKED